MRPLVSFAITVKDEFEEFRALIEYLANILGWVPYPFEVVVLVDGKENFNKIGGIPSGLREKIEIRYGDFDGDFASWKNGLSSLCSGEYIFQIDADEIPPESILRTLDAFLKTNSRIDLFRFPRLNVVKGIEADDLARWGWKTQIVKGFDLPVVNFPDYQGRLYRNRPGIKWVRPVHETIDGAESHAYLPAKASVAILHVKTIERQREQNARYQILMNGGRS